MKAKELANVISESVNSGINPTELRKVFSVEHRHLQSEIFKQIIKPTICEYAKLAENQEYDMRNRQVLKTCKEIADSQDWNY